jgi:hypothetical protein
MFKWLKKKFSRKKSPSIEDELKGKAVASMRYVLDKDGIIYLDFFWDNDIIPTANEAFTVLFSQINSGDLLEESLKFIEETLRENGEDGEFNKFFASFVELQREKIQPFLESFNIKTGEDVVKPTDDGDEVVVKPTDIASHVFRGNQT